MLEQFVKQFSRNIEQVSSKLNKLPVSDIQSQLQQVAKSTFSKMDLVSREEFEVQAEMLMKYRERIVELEERLSAMEKKLSDQEK